MCWQSWNCTSLLFLGDLNVSIAPYRPHENICGDTVEGCVHPAILSSSSTFMHKARLIPMFSPICPINRAEWSARLLPSLPGRALSVSESKRTLLINSFFSIVDVNCNTACAIDSVNPWNCLFLATKSVSQLTSTKAPWFLSTITATRPCDVVLPCNLVAFDQPSDCACSFNHASAWKIFYIICCFVNYLVSTYKNKIKFTFTKSLSCNSKAFLQFENVYPVFFLNFPNNAFEDCACQSELFVWIRRNILLDIIWNKKCNNF